MAVEMISWPIFTKECFAGPEEQTRYHLNTRWMRILYYFQLSQYEYYCYWIHKLKPRRSYVLACWFESQFNLHLRRKPVFVGCDQVDSNWPAELQRIASLEILDLAGIYVLLSQQWTTKGLIRLCGCAGWSVPLLFVIWHKHIVLVWPNQYR